MSMCCSGIYGDEISEGCSIENYRGGKLMETGSNHWINPNSACINNEIGLTVLPGGKRNSDGTFSDIGNNAFFWTSETWTVTSQMAMFQVIPYGEGFCTSILSEVTPIKDGHSIRCVKD